MTARKIRVLLLTLGTLLILADIDVLSLAHAQISPSLQAEPSALPEPKAMPIGTVVDITGDIITLATDSGMHVKVRVQESTSILRAVPGVKNLTGATPLPWKQLQAGDRLLVRGAIRDDQSMAASVILAMKHADLDERRQWEQEDWRERGVGA
jgi:hypothetical protein